MVRPLGDDDSARRTVPVVTYVLIALNVLVFFLELSAGDTFIKQWDFVPSRFSANPAGEAPTEWRVRDEQDVSLYPSRKSRGLRLFNADSRLQGPAERVARFFTISVSSVQSENGDRSSSFPWQRTIDRRRSWSFVSALSPKVERFLNAAASLWGRFSCVHPRGGGSANFHGPPNWSCEQR